MRRPNGSGTVYRLSGKRSKPWIARITLGWTDEGKQIWKTIGTYQTKREASEALAKYLYIPDEKVTMTLKEAFEGWSAQYSGSHSTIVAYRSAYRKLGRYYSIEMDKLNLDLMQEMVDTPPCSYATASAVKKMLSVSLDYAYARDACSDSRVKLLAYVKLPERKAVREINVFSDDEIQDAIDQKAVAAVVLLFTGLRRSELLSLDPADIHLGEQYIHVSKSKTAAGIRDVPIPDRLIPFVKSYIDQGSLGRSTAWFQSHHWKPFKVLQPHTRHECRHTYITKLAQAGVDQRWIKSLVGHTGTVTEDVYTHITIKEKIDLVNEVFSKYLPDLAIDGKGFEYTHLSA